MIFLKHGILPPLALLIWLTACSAPREVMIRRDAPDRSSQPSTEAPPPSPAPVLSVPDNNAALPIISFSIQVGAFSTAIRAEDYALSLQLKGLDTFYFVDTDGLFKVRFDRFDTRAAALAEAVKLQSIGTIDVFLIVQPMVADDHPLDDPHQVRHLPSVRDRLLGTALRFIGTPYRWGGAAEEIGFDCSGLTMTVYRLNGLELPRSAREQYRTGVAVNREQMASGDLVFFATNRKGWASHVGIYCGDDRFIHAPGRGKKVRMASLEEGYFAKRFLGARRYFQ